MDRVLIAEDDPVLTKILKNYLKKDKDIFETVTVTNGLEAIHVLQKYPVSLLVTDLKMPKIDGLSLLAYMSRNYPHIPCIIITAHSTPILKRKLEREVVRYLEKPFKMKDLSLAIKNSLYPDTSLKSVQAISIVSFLQLIKLEKKTCLCEIESPKGNKGWFYFQNGTLYDAAYKDIQGAEAAIAMISTNSCTIHFQELPDKSIKHKISMDIADLIVQASQSDNLPKQKLLHPAPQQQQNPAKKQTNTRSNLQAQKKNTLTTGLKSLFKIFPGYQGAAILDNNGNVLECDVDNISFDLKKIQDSCKSMSNAASDLCQSCNIGPWQEAHIKGSEGSILFLSHLSAMNENIKFAVFFDSYADIKQSIEQVKDLLLSYQ